MADTIKQGSMSLPRTAGHGSRIASPDARFGIDSRARVAVLSLVGIAVAVVFTVALVRYHVAFAGSSQPTGFVQSFVVWVYNGIGFASSLYLGGLILLWSVIAFLTGRGPGIALRVLASIIFCISLAALTAAFDGQGGELGRNVADRLLQAFGSFLTIVLLGVMTLAAALLATDWFFFRSFLRWSQPFDAEERAEDAVTFEEEMALAPELAGDPSPLVSQSSVVEPERLLVRPASADAARGDTSVAAASTRGAAESLRGAQLLGAAALDDPRTAEHEGLDRDEEASEVVASDGGTRSTDTRRSRRRRRRSYESQESESAAGIQRVAGQGRPRDEAANEAPHDDSSEAVTDARSEALNPALETPSDGPILPRPQLKPKPVERSGPQRKSTREDELVEKILEEARGELDELARRDEPSADAIEIDRDVLADLDDEDLLSAAGEALEKAWGQGTSLAPSDRIELSAELSGAASSEGLGESSPSADDPRESVELAPDRDSRDFAKRELEKRSVQASQAADGEDWASLFRAADDHDSSSAAGAPDTPSTEQPSTEQPSADESSFDEPNDEQPHARESKAAEQEATEPKFDAPTLGGVGPTESSERVLLQPQPRREPVDPKAADAAPRSDREDEAAPRTPAGDSEQGVLFSETAIDDTRLDRAAEVALNARRPTPSLLQRRLGVSYAEAREALEALAAIGAVEPPVANGAWGPRIAWSDWPELRARR